MESVEILRTIIIKRANQLLKHGNAMVMSKKNDFYIFMKTYIYSRILESLAGCRTMLLFAVVCKIGALERNAY